MFTEDDETLARPREVGELIHRVIGHLAEIDLCPDARAIMTATAEVMARFAPIEARAHRQNVAGGALAFFRHLRPPDGWRFVGRELHVGLGRVDLVWSGPGGLVLVDEVKTGGWLRRPVVTAQVHRYLDCARSVWPDRFVGLRLLSTADPYRSLFYDPAGRDRALHDTPHVRNR